MPRKTNFQASLTLTTLADVFFHTTGEGLKVLIFQSIWHFCTVRITICYDWGYIQKKIPAVLLIPSPPSFPVKILPCGRQESRTCICICIGLRSFVLVFGLWSFVLVVCLCLCLLSLSSRVPGREDDRRKKNTKRTEERRKKKEERRK